MSMSLQVNAFDLVPPYPTEQEEWLHLYYIHLSRWQSSAEVDKQKVAMNKKCITPVSKLCCAETVLEFHITEQSFSNCVKVNKNLS